jgi:hypothetical protein
VSLTSSIIVTKQLRQLTKYQAGFMEYVLKMEGSMALPQEISPHSTKNQVRKVPKKLQLNRCEKGVCLGGSVFSWRPKYFRSSMSLSSPILWMHLCQARNFMVSLWYEAPRKELGALKARY